MSAARRRVVASVDSNDPKGWVKPAGPARLPEPTFWPVGLALGLVLFAMGPALQYVVWSLLVTAGGLLMAVSLRGWILEIRNDLRSRDE